MLAISALAALTVIGAEGLTAAAGNSFTVSNNGMSAYTIDGANNPTLTLTRGQTYTFTVNSFGHPFWITTARGAGDTASNAFSTGVTNNGASPGTLTFAVPVSAPATLFYQCSFHDIMGGTLNIVSGTAAAAPSLGLPALFSLAALLMCVAVFMFGKRAQA
ncbi:MAG TPA: hypothetical protein VGJ91_08275 [Polyangiaceae bacterium]